MNRLFSVLASGFLGINQKKTRPHWEIRVMFAYKSKWPDILDLLNPEVYVRGTVNDTYQIIQDKAAADVVRSYRWTLDFLNFLYDNSGQYPRLRDIANQALIDGVEKKLESGYITSTRGDIGLNNNSLKELLESLKNSPEALQIVAEIIEKRVIDFPDLSGLHCVDGGGRGTTIFGYSKQGISPHRFAQSAARSSESVRELTALFAVLAEAKARNTKNPELFADANKMNADALKEIKRALKEMWKEQQDLARRIEAGSQWMEKNGHEPAASNE